VSAAYPEVREAVLALALEDHVVHDDQDAADPPVLLEVLLLLQQFFHQVVLVLRKEEPRVPAVLEHLLL